MNTAVDYLLQNRGGPNRPWIDCCSYSTEAEARSHRDRLVNSGYGGAWMEYRILKRTVVTEEVR